MCELGNTPLREGHWNEDASCCRRACAGWRRADSGSLQEREFPEGHRAFYEGLGFQYTGDETGGDLLMRMFL